MKNTILLSLVLCLFYNAKAATYYFSSSAGDDSRTSAQAQNPSTPWRTLNKLNAFMPNLKPGDVILFQRDDIFDGSINVTRSGTSSQPIVFSAYGSGSQPVINGFSTLSDWVSLGNGIWESSCSNCGTEVNSVIINGQPHAMGRYPNSNTVNKGYLNIDAVSSSTISSNKLNSTVNWVGAELVTRTDRYVLDRNKITGQSGSTINFTSATSYKSMKVNYGFFIQNHQSTLDMFGEWYFDPATKKIKVYFGAAGPSSYIVQATAVNDLINISNVSHLQFKNLILAGANINGIKITRGENIQISDTEINYSGVNGVNASYTNNIKILNSSILYSNNGGLFLYPLVSGSTIQANIIKNTATLPGMGSSGDLKYIGVLVNGAENLIADNQVQNTGYNAIHFYGGSNTVVKNNLVDKFCFVKDDGAGIYTWNKPENPTTFTGQRISDNIVLNGIGAPEGVANPDGFRAAPGIYIDDNASNIEISGNTVANCHGAGFFNHNGHELDVKNNTFFNNKGGQIIFQHDKKLPLSPIRNVNLVNNIFFASTYSQEVAAYKTIADDITLFGNFDLNYYCRPMDDTYVVYTEDVKSGKKRWNSFELEGWQKAYGKDIKSKKSPVQITPYHVNKLVGENKVSNGNFDSKISGTSGWSQAKNLRTSWNSGGKLDGGSLEASFSSVASTTNPAYISMHIGEVSANKNYIVRFSLLGAKDGGTVASYLRKLDSPYNELSYTKYTKISSSRNEHEILFSSPKAESNASLIFELRDEDGTVWFDNIEVYEAEVTLSKPEDHIRFEYNASGTTKTIKLSESYIGVNGANYSGSIELAPYSSLILIKSVASTTIKSKLPLANAGEDQNVTTDSDGLAIVTLDGSASSDEDDSIVSYVWTTGSKQLATGVKPVVTFSPGKHAVTLTVTDKNGETGSDEVVITVKEGGMFKSPSNLTAEGVSDSQINLKWQVNTNDEDGFVLERSTRADFSGSVAKINLPSGASDYQDMYKTEGIIFYYRIRAKKGDIETDFSNIASAVAERSLDNSNDLPVVSAGLDQTLTLPMNHTIIEATGSGSDGSIASWEWTKVGGPAVTLSGANTATLSISNLQEGNYTFKVKVTDSKGAIADDVVQVTVLAAPVSKPAANTDAEIVDDRYYIEKVYPNPASTYLDVVYHLESTSPLEIVLMDMNGNTVLRRDYDARGRGKHKERFLLPSLQNGIYVLQWKCRDQKIVKQIMVQQ